MGEHPASELSEIETIAETARSDGNKIAHGRKHLGCQSEKQSIDVRLSMNDMTHCLSLHRGFVELEIGRVGNHGIKVAEFRFVIEELSVGVKILRSLRKNKILVVDVEV